MAYNNRDLKRDSRGNIVPQYYDPRLDDYQPLYGSEGAVGVSNLNRKWREDFAGTVLSGDWTTVSTGSGHSVSVSNSVLQINTGVVPNTETILRTVGTYRIPFQVTFIAYLSQRIANQEFYLEVVDSNGQHYVQWYFDGTNNSTVKIATANAGTINGPSSVTALPSGSYQIYELDLFPDDVHFSMRTPDSTDTKSYSYTRNRLIPDPERDYYIRIRARNLSTAPASSTILYLDAITVQDMYPMSAEIISGTGAINGSQALPVYMPTAPALRNTVTSWTETTTPLGGNASFTGATRDLGNPGSYSYFRALAISDQNGVLVFEQSADGTNWIGVRAINLLGGDSVFEEVLVITRYLRVRYQNGSTAQSSFRLFTAAVAV